MSRASHARKCRQPISATQVRSHTAPLGPRILYSDPVRYLFSIVVFLHGLIHLLGLVKAMGWAELSQLKLPISRPMGLLWLLAGLLVMLAALVPMSQLWKLGVAAAIVSQVVIVCAWSDAKAGTVANLILLIGAVYSYAAWGGSSFRAEYAREVARVLTQVPQAALLTEADMAHLPSPVQQYLRVSGALGKPRPTSLVARWKGRIRGGATEPWMDFTAEQVNTFGSTPARLFLMDATMKGLPTDVFHRFVDEQATFRVRLLSLVPVVDAKGPEMTHSETVTMFNDICLLAPGRLVDPSIRWEAIDGSSARAFYTQGHETISAELHFDARGMLIDFVSDDRAAASKDGSSFVRQRWSTPLTEARRYGELLLPSTGSALWHPKEGPSFSYIELVLLELRYEPSAATK